MMSYSKQSLAFRLGRQDKAVVSYSKQSLAFRLGRQDKAMISYSKQSLAFRLGRQRNDREKQKPQRQNPWHQWKHVKV